MKECIKNRDRENLLKADLTTNMTVDTMLDATLMLRQIRYQAIKQKDFFKQNKNK